MNVKSYIKETNENGPVTYPCLMEGVVGANVGMVVLFDCEGCGMVVHQPNRAGSLPVGYYSNEWAMPLFQPFKGTVVLEG